MNKRTDRTSQIKDIGILIGKEILSTDQAPCGRICALEFEDGWVDGNILFSKQIDLSDLKNCLNFEVNQRLTEPIVRVTIRPSSGGDERVQELKNCLKQLTVLDSAVRVVEQEDGDLALITAGEIHLQKCLEDLKALGQTETSVSEPIVPFLETIVPELSVPLNKALLDHITECNLRLHSIKFTLRSVPLSAEIIQILAENSYLLDALQENENATNNSSEINQLRLKIISSATATLPKLKGTWWFKRNPAEIEHLFTNIWAFGPSRAKLNIFFDHSTKQGSDKDSPASNFGIHNCIWNSNLRQIEQTIVAGFHLAMSHGPLCDEPIQGVGVILEDFVQAPQPDTDSTHYLYGQLISAVRQTIRASLQKHPLRLLAAMYKCTVQTTAQTLGKVQSVLAQRRAKVILEDVNEATSLFEITSHMPVIESFSFCENLRKRTSGNASAHLEFSHWQLIDEDPYWEPKTEEEIEEFGVGKGCVNQARAYVIQVRKRKGLPTDELIVVNAEKQRNLKRNK